MSRSTSWCCTTMISRLAALFLLSGESLICTAEAPVLVSVTVVKPGDNVNLTCTVSSDKQVFNWYKQPPGHMLHTVVSRILKKEIEQFIDERFTFTKVDNQYFLTIVNVSKEDEATYFCQSGTMYKYTFVSGTFLAVNDENPEKVSGRPGQQATLQCSLVSKRKGNTVQCPGRDSVSLFRAGSGSGLSRPNFIYVHENSDDDDGTHRCAVLTCGNILFGEETKVETRNLCDLTVPVLGVLLACCVAVIVALGFFVIRNQRNVCKHCKGRRISELCGAGLHCKESEESEGEERISTGVFVLCCGTQVSIKTSIKLLQLIQNAAARVLTNSKEMDHITPVLKSLHCLPVCQRIEFKTLLLADQSLNGLGPKQDEAASSPVEQAP
uniref:uncharacterized protein LOC122778726 isoform X2 n=1 Tax=Solea senegalensis TaxID=28829 RepID=UPI001CD8ED69|nr:uncharacterized protein LOC122778726 isoform X2 [Solea senegalensis]